MDRDRSPDYVLIVMKNLNLIIILYIAGIITHGQLGYIHDNSALDFLTYAGRVPVAAWKIPAVSLGLYGSCLLLLHIRNKSSLGLFFKVCIEFAISFGIGYMIGFSYTGIVLLILADALRYFPKSKWKFPFAAITCMIYLLADINLLSVRYQITPLEVYLGYFQNDVKSVLIGIKNVFDSLNMVTFIVYIILLVRMQFNEKERILSLNEKLNMTNDELKQANVQLEKYAKESEKAAETRERNRLAREIHDTLGHSLTGIATGIEACTTLMDVAPEATKEQLRVIAEIARQGITDVRRSVKALRPDALEKMDLEKALEQMINETRCATSVEILYQCTAGLNCFNADEEDIIYRIVQESITNAIRHGKARQIQIDIERDFNILKIRIADNGIGCKNIEKGFGLHHMEERLGLLKGSLTYHGENGFVVEAQVPIRWGSDEA